MSSSAVTAEPGNIEVFPWLKTLPLAPEFYPSLAEFQDPIAYIFKIEKEASKYGICKIIPPVSALSKKTIITNLNASLAARSTSSNPKSSPTFTTRQQQIGFCPRKHRPVQKPVWQSGENYTVPQFTAKAKSFEKNYLKKIPKKTLTPLEVETLYWKANGDKPFSVEYANDMPGSAFAPVSARKYGKEAGDSLTVGDTAWNMRGVSRAKGSLLRFMKEEIPGVTSPMVYIAMMFSWFAWHVEDHDLHSLNYMHMGAGKTWYGVPRDAAVALEEVIRMQGYGGEINPLVTFHILGEKNTVMSPEVLISAGIPCCRLVQNAGEFVVTFPRAYHSGFSHGFNCGEAANIATPEWLRFAKDAAIRRASINSPPMVSHCQLLYDLALSLCSRISRESNSEPRSSRLKDRKKGEGETQVKELFVEDVKRNNELLHILGQGSSIVLLPQNSLDDVVDSTLEIASQFKGNPGLSFGLFSATEGTKTSGSLVSDNFMLNTKMEVNKLSGLSTFTSPTENERERTDQGNKLSDKGLFSCATCGVLSFACVAIVQPRDAATRHFTSADCTIFSNRDTGSDSVSSDGILCAGPSNSQVLKSCSGWMDKKVHGGLFEVPIQSVEKLEPTDQHEDVISNIKMKTASTALGLLASAYGNTSESDNEEHDEVGVVLYDDKVKAKDRSPKSEPGKSRSEDLNCYVEVDVNSSSIHKESNIAGTSANCKAVPHTTNSTLTFENESGPVALGSNDGDSSRLHVFCLQHAVEVEKQLRPLGGSHILLLCHPDYQELEAAAKELAEEMGIDYAWNDIAFREATEEDEEKIQLALESEDALHGNGDWSVRLGINLYYSAILSRSPLYSKQMPYNTIIYKAFGRFSPSSTPTKLKFYGKAASSRQKRIKLAGKWCGKVWMSNQVHPLLVERDTEEEEEPEEEEEQQQEQEEEHEEEEDEEEEKEEEEKEEEEEEERSFYAWGRPEVKLETFVNEIANGVTSSSSTRRSSRKRKQEEVEKAKPLKPSVVKKRAKGKKMKADVVIEEGGEYGCDMEGCTMSFGSKQELLLHKRNICPVKECGKKFFSHKYLVQHRRVHDDDRPLRCPWKGCKMTFKWAWARTEHIRVHTGERPYVCTVTGCGQTFRFVSDFSRHKRKTGHSSKTGRG